MATMKDFLFLLFSAWVGTLLPKARGQATFNFGTTVNSVDVNITDTDPDHSVLFDYTYTGPFPSEDNKAKFEYVIYEPDCTTVHAIFTDNSKAMYFHEFIKTPASDKLQTRLGVDLTLISSSALWYVMW